MKLISAIRPPVDVAITAIATCLSLGILRFVLCSYPRFIQRFVFSEVYIREWCGERLGVDAMLYPFFIAGMSLVLIADDTLALMIAWEVMALSSYFEFLRLHPLIAIGQASGYASCLNCA